MTGKTNVGYRVGRRLTPDQLIERVCGGPLDAPAVAAAADGEVRGPVRALSRDCGPGNP